MFCYMHNINIQLTEALNMTYVSRSINVKYANSSRKSIYLQNHMIWAAQKHQSPPKLTALDRKANGYYKLESFETHNTQSSLFFLHTHIQPDLMKNTLSNRNFKRAQVVQLITIEFVHSTCFPTFFFSFFFTRGMVSRFSSFSLFG